MAGFVLKQFGQLFDEAFSAGINNATKSIVTEASQAAAAQATKRSVSEQASTLYDDLRTQWKATLNSSDIAEATINIVKRHRANPNLDINDEVFTHAGVYAHANNANFADTLYSLENAIATISRNEKRAVPTITDFTQEQFSSMFEKNRAIIEGAYKNPNMSKEISEAFANKVYDAPLKELKANAKILKETGSTLTGDQLTDITLMNVTLNNMNKQKIKQYTDFVNEQIKISKHNKAMGRFAARVNDPSVPVKDIMKPFTNVNALQHYSRAEARDMLHEIDYLLSNRAQINKPFKTEDWNRLTTLKADLEDYIPNAGAGANRPLSKSYNNLVDDGGPITKKQIARDNDKFIRRATGQNNAAMQGFRTPSATTISGVFDETPVGYAGLTFRQDQLGQIMEYGVAGIPGLEKKFWQTLVAKDLPDEIKRAFGFNNLKNVDSTKVGDDLINLFKDEFEFKANFEDMVNNTIRGSKLLNAKGDIEGYFFQNNIRLKLLQDYGELNESALEEAAKRGWKIGDLSKTLLKTDLTQGLSDSTHKYILNTLYGAFGKNDMIGISKILKVFPEYFDRQLTPDVVDALRALDELAKSLKVTDSWGELANKVAGNKELTDLYVEIYEKLGIYAQRLRGQYLKAKALDINENQLISAHVAKESGEEVQTFVPQSSGKTFREIQAKELTDTISASDESRVAKSWYEAGVSSEGGIKSALDDVDLMKNTQRLGGQPGIEDFYKYDALSTNGSSKISQYIKDGIAFATKSPATKDELADLDWVFNGLKNEKGEYFESNYALQNRLSSYVNEVLGEADATKNVALSSLRDNVYGYLMDLRDYVGIMKTRVQNSKDNMAPILYNKLVQFESTVNGHLSRLSTDAFKDSAEATTQSMRRQGNITDSTSLDYMFDRGVYETTTTPSANTRKRLSSPNIDMRNPNTAASAMPNGKVNWSTARRALPPSEKAKLVRDHNRANRVATFYEQEMAALLRDKKMLESGLTPTDRSRNIYSIEASIKKITPELNKATKRRDELRAKMKDITLRDLDEGLRIDRTIIRAKLPDPVGAFGSNVLAKVNASGNDTGVIWEQIHRVERQLQLGAIESRNGAIPARIKLDPKFQADAQAFGLDLHVSNYYDRTVLEDLAFTLRKMVNPAYTFKYNDQVVRGSAEQIASLRAGKINDFLGINGFKSKSDARRGVEPVAKKRAPFTSSKQDSLEEVFARNERQAKEQEWINDFTQRKIPTPTETPKPKTAPAPKSTSNDVTNWLYEGMDDLPF